MSSASDSTANRSAEQTRLLSDPDGPSTSHEDGSPEKSHAGTEMEPRGLFQRVLRTLYGRLPQHELHRVMTLSFTLFFIIGAYWLLRSLKDSVFAAIVGLEYQPKAKMLSLVVILVLVFAYNRIIDKFQKHQLFYIIGTFYFVLFFGISVLLARDDIGLGNKVASPDRYLGWFTYVAIESFGSIAVSMFWAFVNSVVSVQLAESAYGLILAGAQIGAVLGPTAATMATVTGVPLLYFVGSVAILLMNVVIAYYMRRFVGGVHVETQENRKEATGMLEGLRLLLRYPYVLGIFVIGSLFEVIVTIVDYQMKVLGKQAYRSPEEFAQFMGFFGQATNTVSFLFSILGTSFVIRRLGLRKTLMLFPLCVGVAIVAVYLNPTITVLFLSMIAMKALSYALNNPSKEMLYIPTSKAVKFKSKSWIDMFGGRSSKAVGSTITDIFKEPITSLLRNGTLVSIGIAGIMFVVADRMGSSFERLSRTGEIVGQEEEANRQPRTHELQNVEVEGK